MSSDFKEVLRERIEALVSNRLASVDAAVETARQDIDQVIVRLQESSAAATVTAEENAAIEQISAEIAAQIGQAAAESSRLSGDLALLRDSVVDIDSQQTQADVLNSLVERAYSFAPRAVLFVVKGSDAIAWAARGFDDELGDDAVRGLSVSLAADTLLGAVLNGQTTFLGEPGDQKDNGLLLDRLGSTKPERIAGIPLRVRSKTVGILYADTYDTSVGSVGIEALELLVHNAGIIVELASLRQRHAEPAGRGPSVVPTATSPLAAVVAAAPPPPPPPPPVVVALPEPAPEPEVVEAPAAPEPQPVVEDSAPSFDETTSYSELPSMPEPGPAPFSIDEPDRLKTQETPALVDEQVVAAEPEAWVEPEIEPVSAAELAVHQDPERTLEPDEFPTPAPFASPAFEPTFEPNFDSAPSMSPPTPFEVSPIPSGGSPFEIPDDQQPTVQWTPPPAVSAPAPIRASTPPAAGELAPDEEKLHNDARRFARLLVSEIKLYNEQQVAEGRMNGDLYERLRDDIDRSRQMYDKRVAASVAARFDYFYDELVGTLADSVEPMCSSGVFNVDGMIRKQPDERGVNVVHLDAKAVQRQKPLELLNGHAWARQHAGALDLRRRGNHHDFVHPVLCFGFKEQRNVQDHS